MIIKRKYFSSSFLKRLGGNKELKEGDVVLVEVENEIKEGKVIRVDKNISEQNFPIPVKRLGKIIEIVR